jgi:hypothetical protein
MSSDLEVRLREAFEIMSEGVRPPAGLAGRVQIAARRRRRSAIRALAAGTVAVAVAVPIAIAARHTAVPRVRANRGPAVLSISVPFGYDAVAVGGPMLYIAAGDAPNAALSAYNRVTGQLIRRIRVPALPSALAVGPDGMVWLTFSPDQHGGGTGLWLLSPDLGQRASAGLGIVTTLDLAGLLPTGPTTALVGGPGGLDELRMPSPGQHEAASLQHMANVRVDHGLGGGYPTARLAGRIVLLQEDDVGHMRIVLAGPHAPAFEQPAADIVDMAAEGGGLWVATSPQPAGPTYGAVIRLGSRLQVQTPGAIAADPDLRFPSGLLAAGNTVWVSTDSLTRSLFCFRFTPGAGAGPVTYVPTRLPAAAMAATADTVYVGDRASITSYPVPRACR